MQDFEEIYSRYFTDVYRYLVTLCKDKELALELTQDTFFKALKNIDKYDGSGRIYVWLCQIAKNTYFTNCKKEKRKTSLEVEGDMASDMDIEGKLIQDESAFEIFTALHKLEEPYKEVFSLRTFGELPFAQIGVLFGKTESWARVTYYRAKNKIRELI